RLPARMVKAKQKRGQTAFSRKRGRTAFSDRAWQQAVAAAALLLASGAVLAQAGSDATALVQRAAEAMGGAEAIVAVETLEARGYGAEAYFWGGGNITGDPDALQKWAENPDFASVWSFADR